MAVKVIRTSKQTDHAPALDIIRGDSKSTQVRLVVPALVDGVDLSNLVWTVKIKRPDGETDRAMLESTIEDGYINAEWTIGGFATAVPGTVTCKLEGFNGDAVVWQGSNFYLCVHDTYDTEPQGETAEALSEVQNLIIYVDGELGNVIAAGERAEEAATHQPIIGANGNWFIYDIDKGVYEDSGKTAVAGNGTGQGDMAKAVYDPDGDGTVRDSEMLGGIEAEKYALVEYVDSSCGEAEANAVSRAAVLVNGERIERQNDVETLSEQLQQLNNEALKKETDPTVPSWAKASKKPTYTASEVGAVPSAGGDVSGYINFLATTKNAEGVKWTTQDGTVFYIRPYFENNRLQVVVSPQGGSAEAVVKVESNGAVEIIKDLNVTGKSTLSGELNASGGIRGVTNYVTPSTLTGGTWTDGKPVYRRIVSGAVEANVEKTIGWATSGTVGQVLRVDGGIWTGNTFFPLTYQAADGQNLRAYVNKTSAIIKSSIAGTAYFIIEYTKA